VTRYVVQRLLSLLPVLLGVTLLVFLVMQLAPGDPARIMLGAHANEESVTQLRRDLGLDQPWYVQFARWLGGVLRGDWGRSIQLKREVLPYIAGRFQNSAYLMLLAIFMACGMGVPAGILSAVRQYSPGDRIAMVLVLIGFSTPVFWLGIILQIVFGLWFGILPVSGIQTPGQAGTLDLLLHMVLPSLALATAPMAIIARMTRSSMLEVIRQDYMRTAHAKGLAERVMIGRHALRNSLIPVVTIIGLQVGYLLGGDILVELVFSYPGIGLAMVTGILARDFPLVQGAILMVAASYVVVNLVTDLAYAYIDPRIRYGE